MARKYMVQIGETLTEIAQRFYGDASLFKALANANGIADPNKIKTGQVLVLPDPPGRWYPVTITCRFDASQPPFSTTAFFDLKIPAGMHLVVETVSGAYTGRARILA